MFANWPGGYSGLLGLPVPGDRAQAGAQRTASWRRASAGPTSRRAIGVSPSSNARAFDEEGFYRIGDALKFADPARPEEGLLFDGRISEDFKLATGTWVSVGGMREKIIGGGAPLVQDAVIAGHDRDDIGAILFPRLDDCRRLASDLPADARAAAPSTAHPAVRERFEALLGAAGPRAPAAPTGWCAP